MRLYKTGGRAEYHCSGHPIHSKGRKADGEGHHSVVFIWFPGSLHIDEHDPHPLQGCNHGCKDYILTDGIDPRV